MGGSGGSAAASSASGTAVSSWLSASTEFEQQVPRELGQLQQLSQLLSFEKQVATVHLGISNFARKYSELDIIVDEMEAGRGAGVQSEVEQYLQRADEISALWDTFSRAHTATQEYGQKLREWVIPTAVSIEKAVWVHWIANLTDHDLLDRDAIEDYLHDRIGVLGEGGLLGVDTRELFDTDKEEKAIANAQARKDEIFNVLLVHSL